MRPGTLCLGSKDKEATLAPIDANPTETVGHADHFMLEGRIKIEPSLVPVRLLANLLLNATRVILSTNATKRAIEKDIPVLHG